MTNSLVFALIFTLTLGFTCLAVAVCCCASIQLFKCVFKFVYYLQFIQHSELKLPYKKKKKIPNTFY